MWELGQIFRGPWAETFWSSHGCLFHHAYPVGYCASKRVFGRDFSMQIAAGAHSPIFEVSVPCSVQQAGVSPALPDDWIAAPARWLIELWHDSSAAPILFAGHCLQNPGASV